MQRVLFLCTGNYYRSRFAEEFFNWHAAQRGIRWSAESRGLALTPRNVGPISTATVERLKGHGIAAAQSERFPIDVSPEDFQIAHQIVAVKGEEHRPLMEDRFPEWIERVEFWEVHDVDFATPDVAFPQLEAHVLDLMNRLASGQEETA